MSAVGLDSSDLSDLDLQQFHKCSNTYDKVQEWFLLVNVQTQRLHALHQKQAIRSYVVSTAANGTGQEEGSGKTPLGWHRIEEKIGEGAHPYAIFDSREQTGQIADPNGKVAYIVGRILRLRGLEEGINCGVNEAGQCVDSFKRYIYIHGTNDLQNLGKAMSAGCVRMSPEDAIDLFGRVPNGTPMYIF